MKMARMWTLIMHTWDKGQKGFSAWQILREFCFPQPEGQSFKTRKKRPLADPYTTMHIVKEMLLQLVRKILKRTEKVFAEKSRRTTISITFSLSVFRLPFSLLHIVKNLGTVICWSYCVLQKNVYLSVFKIGVQSCCTISTTT